MIALLLTAWASVAHADPAILRTASGGFGGHIGLRDVSVGGMLTEHVGVAVDLPYNAGSVTASAGGRWELHRGPKGWGVEAVVSGGLVFPTRAAGIGLEVAPALFGGVRTQRFTATLGLAVPASVAWAGGVQARVPAIVEAQLGGHVGSVWLLFWLRGGLSVNPGVDNSIVFDPGLTIVFDRPVVARRREG